MPSFSLKLAVCLSLMSAGCATIEGNYDLTIDAPASPTFSVPASAFTVADVSQTKTTMEFTLGLGFERIADSLYKPTPAEMLKTKLERSIQATGGPANIDVLVLDAGLFVKRQVEDRIPIVNIFAFGRTIRPYMCGTQVVIRSGAKSERKSFESVTEPIDPTDEHAFKVAVNQCQYELARGIASAASGLLSPIGSR